MSSFEMRVYQIASGKMAKMQALMREVMAPLMHEYSMEPLGFFITTDDERVYWFVNHAGKSGIEANWDRFHADQRWRSAMAERTLNGSFLASETSTPMKGINGLTPMLEQQNLATVGAYADGLFRLRDPSVVDRYAAPDMVNHNPEAPPGPEGVKEFIQHFFGQFPDTSAASKRMAAQGEYVFVHSLLKTGPGYRGSAIADIFRSPMAVSPNTGTSCSRSRRRPPAATLWFEKRPWPISRSELFAVEEHFSIE